MNRHIGSGSKTSAELTMTGLPITPFEALNVSRFTAERWQSDMKVNIKEKRNTMCTLVRGFIFKMLWIELAAFYAVGFSNSISLW